MNDSTALTIAIFLGAVTIFFLGVLAGQSQSTTDWKSLALSCQSKFSSCVHDYRDLANNFVLLSNECSSYNSLPIINDAISDSNVSTIMNYSISNESAWQWMTYISNSTDNWYITDYNRTFILMYNANLSTLSLDNNSWIQVPCNNVSNNICFVKSSIIMPSNCSNPQFNFSDNYWYCEVQ